MAEPLRFLEATFPAVENALALEEGLLTAVDARKSPGTLFVWEWPSTAVIVGRSNIVAREVHVSACEQDGVPILRRCSGGGAVVLGYGCLCYALVLPISPDQRTAGISATTQAIIQRTAAGFIAAGHAVTVEGISDLAMNRRKFSGNSQRWMRTALLHHGTILYDFDLPQIGRYLKFPSRQPDYRATRDHAAFVCNAPVSRSDVISILTSTWNAKAGAWLPEETDRAAELLQSRYSDADWHRGRE